jgi:hypothetical protein
LSRFITPEILADRQVTAGHFLQHAQAMLSVIDRLDFVHVQQVGQLACIDPVTLKRGIGEVPETRPDSELKPRGSVLCE